MPNMYSYVHDLNSWIDPFGLMTGVRLFDYIIEQGDLKGGWEHIDARHITGDHPTGAGDLFSSNTTRESLERAANKIVKKGTRVSSNFLRRMQVFEMVIKVKGNKKELVRVFVDTVDKKIITIFPARGGCH